MWGSRMDFRMHLIWSRTRNVVCCTFRPDFGIQDAIQVSSSEICPEAWGRLPSHLLSITSELWSASSPDIENWEGRSTAQETTTRTEVIYWEDSLHYLCDRMITKRLHTSQLTRASANKRVGLWTLVLPRSSELIRICTISYSLTSRCLSVSAD